MKKFRFSPIENIDQLLAAIRYTHNQCSKLCKEKFGRYLPNAGNIGIFCHNDEEYLRLSELRETLTELADNWNNKYYRLREPIFVPAQGEVPEAVFSYLYIRQPDPAKPQVGDVDFVLGREEYDKLKTALSQGQIFNGLKILDRPELDLIELSDPEVDVISFIGTKNMAENVAQKTND